jgi:threonylcarbamoyladenosine tRNA methylthiotransferase MtaB
MFSTPGTVAFHTLGCKLNFAETSTIARMFAEKGFVKKGFDEGADVYVINTCSVTANADKECRSVVSSALSKNPEAFIAVIGCYAQLKPEEISGIPGVDVVLGASEKFKLLDYIRLSGKNTHAEIHNCGIEETNLFVEAFSAGDRTRSFLKVQDGCDYSCTFCTIPLARGKSRSDSIENVITNAEKIAAMNVREIVLTGVNIGDFGYFHQHGIDRKKKQAGFYDLVKDLDKVEGIDRFRISSIEPNLLSDEIIGFVANSKKFVPHFHMPLQSGSNRILKLMKRRYLRELYTEKVSRIKSQMPGACIGADVIVGFPGETESDFMETYNFLNGLDVSYLHVFTYSERSDTEAINLSGTVPVVERKRRNKMLRILSAKKLRAFYEGHLNTKAKVIFEHEEKNNFMYGFTENYIKVRAPYNAALCNELVPVMLEGIDEDGSVTCSIINEEVTSLNFQEAGL